MQKINCCLLFCMLFVGVLHAQLGIVGEANEQWLSDSTKLILSEGQQLVLHRSGDTLLHTHYEACTPFSVDLKEWYLVVKEDGKAGMINLEQEVIIPFAFAQIAYQSYGTDYVHVRDEEGRGGIWSLSGKEILAPKYYLLGAKANGLFPATDFDTRLAGVVDSQGKVRLPFKYKMSDVLKESDLLIAAEKSGKKALFDPHGEQLTDFAYWAFNRDKRLPGIIFAKDYAQQYALLDTLGKQLPVHPVDWYAITPHSICVRIDDKCGFLSLDGEYITGYDYEYVSSLYSDARQRVLAKKLNIEAPEYLVGKGLRGDTMYVISNQGKEYLDPDTHPIPSSSSDSPVVVRRASTDTLTLVEKPDTPAQFPEGEAALMKFIGEHLTYPEIARENNITGIVVVGFTVEKDGSLTHIDVLQDIGNGCGQAAQRLVRQMSKWTPAEHEGKRVRSRVTLPIRFALRE